MFTKKVPKLENYFYCEKCDYKCSKKSLLQRHENTRKHLNVYKKSSTDFLCKKCDKVFSCRQSLYAHKKKCETKKESKVELNIGEIKENSLQELLSIENFMELMKQNNEFKDLILEQNKIIADLAKNSNNTVNNINTINNNSHNKTFNLQVFLNEKCKDALNIDEFIDSLKISFSDLENLGEKGFVDGVSRIFVNGLKSLDIYKRPIHCSDLKRETMHLKEQNVWEKDNANKDGLKKAVKLIAHKNMLKVNDWKQLYPQYKDSDSKKNDQYLKILVGAAGPYNNEDEEICYNKIIKNVAKEVTIVKQIV